MTRPRYTAGMHPFDEMKSYVGFNPDDEARLRAFHDAAASELPGLVDRFYDEVLAAPRARAVLRDEAQVERLRVTLKQWLGELLKGPHDGAYYERRQRIGRVHVDVQLPSRFMFTAMSVVRRDLCALALSRGFDMRTCDSIERVTSLDLAIMTGTYIESRDRIELTSLQELIVSHMPVTVLLIDADGRITAATHRRARLFGGTDVVGRPYATAFPAPLVLAARLEDHVNRALTARREVALMRIDAELEGQPRSFRFTIVPLEHRLAAALIHVEELTEAVSTEARLQRAEALAQMGTFSAAVAHELRNPLAGMRGALQVIADSLDEDDARRAIMGKVDQQIVRLNELITDLLQFARPPEARRRRLDLAAAAHSAVDAVRVEHPDVQFQVQGAGIADADDQLVHRILVNLLKNAVQATGAQGHVLARVEDAQVLVNDDGPGIPAENRARIFQPFFTTKTRGTGLGLAICSQAAAAMGGRLSLGEGPLKGAAFVLELEGV